jgi:hypothetical protein
MSVLKSRVWDRYIVCIGLHYLLTTTSSDAGGGWLEVGVGC